MNKNFLIYQRFDMPDNAIEIFDVQINLENQNIGPLSKTALYGILPFKWHKCNIGFVCETITELSLQYPIKTTFICSINDKMHSIKGKSYIVSREYEYERYRYTVQFTGLPCVNYL